MQLRSRWCSERVLEADGRSGCAPGRGRLASRHLVFSSRPCQACMNRLHALSPALHAGPRPIAATTVATFTPRRDAQGPARRADTARARTSPQRRLDLAISRASLRITVAGPRRAYIATIPVIFDGNRLRPRAGEAQGEFTMSAQPLMPKATAVWLVENTALSFDQIADFCKLHPLEVKAIADDEGAQSIIGRDPIVTGQLTPRGNRQGRGRSQLPAQACRCQGPSCRNPSARRGRAIRRYRAARTVPTPSCGWCATIRS